MLEVFLIRHGETAWNAAGRAQGISDRPLNAVGRAQAAAAADALTHAPMDTMYTSDLSRARETADVIAAPHGVDVHAHPDLREMHHGELDGLTFQEMQRDYGDVLQAWLSDPTDVVIPGGESLRQVQERAWAAFQEILGKHAHGCIAIVSHTMTLRTIVARALSIPLSHCLRFHIDTGSITTLEVDGRVPGIVLRTLNHTAHLNARSDTA